MPIYLRYYADIPEGLGKTTLQSLNLPSQMPIYLRSYADIPEVLERWFEVRSYPGFFVNIFPLCRTQISL